MKKSKALAALTQAALVLPGLATAAEIQTDYLFSHYQERDIRGSNLGGGSAERYEIQSHLFRVVSPYRDNTVGLNLTYESMSGASPWFIQPGADGKPMQVMSGASIREERVDIEGSLSRALLGGVAAVSLGYSTEDDYQAINGGVEFEIEQLETPITWSGGIGFSHDTLEPVQKTGITRIDEDNKNSVTLYGGAAIIIDAATVAQISVGYQHHDGFLTDPYKQAWFTNLANALPESRPDGRQAWTVSGKLRHHLGSPNAAVHVDYRFYRDDWEIESHTLELAWHQVLPQQWRLSPSLRWYSQSQAFFYAPYYNDFRADGFASSDYRLSPYGALSARVDVLKSIGALSLGGGVEYYEASDSYALKNVDVENPGLVEFLNFTVRLSYRF